MGLEMSDECASNHTMSVIYGKVANSRLRKQPLARPVGALFSSVARCNPISGNHRTSGWRDARHAGRMTRTKPAGAASFIRPAWESPSTLKPSGV